jgi:predicted Ser/Thr protein kinase
MKRARKALEHLNQHMTLRGRRPPIPFEEFLGKLEDSPTLILRNVFQVFHDLITSHLGPGIDEYPDDPESIHYVRYDCSRLFEQDTHRPFFADRLFANRLVSVAETLERGSQQNKIYIFRGPPGGGKSTFFNNILKKLEDYANSDEGMRYEVLWRLDPKALGVPAFEASYPLIDQLTAMLQAEGSGPIERLQDHGALVTADGMIEIPCPSHDYPLLIIPRRHRQAFLTEIFEGTPFEKAVFSNPEYSWVLRDKPCTICSAIYRVLHNRLKSAAEVHRMVYARHYAFNRRIGEGITVFSPGDPPAERNVYSNAVLAGSLHRVLKEAEIHYEYSRYAKTNNGVYALMDVKSHNVERLIELHNIISEGLHKVDCIEENVNSLFLAVMNPEDQKNISDFKSFTDRIEYINVPYVMDLNTEVKIYRTVFGHDIDEFFLPRVLENFARVVIATRLSSRSDALLEWISNPRKYRRYCDDNLQLLKMEIYAGVIPPWLSEEDRKNLNAKRRRRIIDESDHEGDKGISGRDSIRIFGEFYSSYARKDKPVTMSNLCDFFRREHQNLTNEIPDGFFDSLLRMYNYTVLQEVKESLFFYNDREISRDILNYIFAVNFEPPATEVCTFTKDKLQISDEFFARIENNLLGSEAAQQTRRRFREETQREYTTRTLTQEMRLDKTSIESTEIFRRLFERYMRTIKEKSLDPFLDNDNFRRAIKDYNLPDFKTYDQRTRTEVCSLIRNLGQKFKYTEQGAKEVCIYVIDNDLARIRPDGVDGEESRGE